MLDLLNSNLVLFYLDNYRFWLQKVYMSFNTRNCTNYGKRLSEVDYSETRRRDCSSVKYVLK